MSVDARMSSLASAVSHAAADDSRRTGAESQSRRSALHHRSALAALIYRSDAVTTQVDTAVGFGNHAFAEESVPLVPGSLAALGYCDPSLCIDHPIPGNLAVRGQRSQRASNASGAPRQAGGAGDGTIGAYASCGNGGNGKPDALIDADRFGHIHPLISPRPITSIIIETAKRTADMVTFVSSCRPSSEPAQAHSVPTSTGHSSGLWRNPGPPALPVGQRRPQPASWHCAPSGRA